jgi:hypothetical protein
MKTLEPGSYSEATMRIEDLLPVFVAMLLSVGWARKGNALRHPDGRTIVGCDDHGFDGDHWCEDCSWLLNEDIWDALNEHCPDGYYFGAHEGDGACYGVWECEDTYDDDEDYDDPMDGDFDSGMASAGHGTDEDYGYYGDDW